MTTETSQLQRVEARFRRAIEIFGCCVGAALCLIVIVKLSHMLLMSADLKFEVPHAATLLLIGLAAMFWPTIAKFKTPFGEFERVAQEAKQEIKAAVEQSKNDLAVTVADAQTHTVIAVSDKRSPIAQAEKRLGRPKVENDPQKGRFGGLSTVASKSLSATVKRASGELYEIVLVFRDEDMKSERSLVRFYLHPTFPKDIEDVAVRNGEARLQLIAYGAFTVGAIAADGTMLEFDLAECTDDLPEGDPFPYL